MLLIVGVSITACNSEPEIDTRSVQIETRFKRFDQAFFETDTTHFETALAEVKKQYPLFFQNNGTLRFWRNLRTEELRNKLHQKAQKIFGDLEPENAQLDLLLKHYYALFGTQDTLSFFTHISRLDFNYPILPADSVYFVALDLYLGKESPFYQGMPRYLAYNRQPQFLVRDLGYTLYENQVNRKKVNETLLEAMVYFGKIYYLLEQSMPEITEADLMQYPPDKLKFAQEHEKEMWVYFIENQLLFRSSADAKRRFIDVAPFSKFRTELDVNTPGQIGHWFGYKIVKAFHAQNPQLSFQELIAENDAQKILKLSAYKP